MKRINYIWKHGRHEEMHQLNEIYHSYNIYIYITIKYEINHFNVMNYNK